MMMPYLNPNRLVILVPVTETVIFFEPSELIFGTPESRK